MRTFLETFALFSVQGALISSPSCLLAVHRGRLFCVALCCPFARLPSSSAPLPHPRTRSHGSARCLERPNAGARAVFFRRKWVCARSRGSSRPGWPPAVAQESLQAVIARSGLPTSVARLLGCVEHVHCRLRDDPRVRVWPRRALWWLVPFSQCHSERLCKDVTLLTVLTSLAGGVLYGVGVLVVRVLFSSP